MSSLRANITKAVEDSELIRMADKHFDNDSSEQMKKELIDKLVSVTATQEVLPPESKVRKWDEAVLKAEEVIADREADWQGIAETLLDALGVRR